MSSTPDRTSLAPAEGYWLELLTRGWREPGDLDATLTRIAEVARQAFDADLSIIFAINPVTRRFVVQPGVAGELLPDGEESSLKPPREHGLTERVIEEGFLAVQDVAGLADDQKGFCLKQGVSAFAAVALRTVRHSKPLAVLYVDYREPQEFSEDLEEKLRRFAGLASRELQVTWFLRRYQWIGQIGQRLNRRVLTEEELFAELSAGVGHVIDTSGCVVWGLRRPESRTVDLFVGKTVKPGVAVDSPLLRLLEGRGGSPGAPDEESAQLLATLGCEGEGASWVPADTLCEPLGPPDAPLGFVSILHREADAFDEEDRHLLRLLAGQVALALANRRLFDHLRRLHAAGRTLSRNLQSETVLQTIVDTIRDSTRCDLAVLFPCDPASEGSFLPTRWSVQVGDESPARGADSVLAAAARSALDRGEPLLLEDARELFTAAADGVGAAFASVAGLPLWIGEEAVGALFLCYRTAQRFQGDPAQKQLIEGLGEYAAIAIENARRFGEEQSRYVRTLEALRELDRKLIRSNDLDELLTTILKIAERRLAERVAPDEASILLYDPVRDELVTRAAIGPNSERSLKQVLRREEGRGITLEVVRTGESILISDTQEAEYRERFVDVGGETRCELDVPLKDGQELVGILNLESRMAYAFEERDRSLMETLAGQAVLAVKKAQAFEEEQRLRKDEETLIELGKELTRQLDAGGLLELILQQAITNTGAQAGVLVRVDPNQRDLVVSAEIGVPGVERRRHLSMEEGILGLVASEGRVVNADLTKPEWRAIHVVAIPGMKSELAVPMKRDDTVIGVINVESPKELAFGPRNERLLEGLADLAVIALQNAEAFERAERRRSRFQLLHEAGERLARITNLDDLGTAYSVVVDIAERQFQSEVVVRRLDASSNELVRVANARTEGPQIFDRIPLEDPLNGRVARERKPLVVPDALNPPPEIGPFRRSNEDRAFLVTPVFLEERYYGNLSLSHPEANRFGEMDVQLAEGLAQQLALTIHRLEEAHAHQEAETISEIGRQSYELMHRLGNDLTPVKLAAGKVRRRLREKAVADPMIEGLLDRIQAYVIGILGLSRKLADQLSSDLRSRRGEEVREVYPVERLVQDAISGFTFPDGGEHRLLVEVNVPLDCAGLKVKVNHREMMDALLNLFRNAAEAMPEGGRLTVEARQADSNVELRVRDTGEGITPANLRKLFDLAFTTKRGNSGFGLWSVKRTVAQSGGEIRVESVVGEGTTFTVVLPCVEEDRGA